MERVESHANLPKTLSVKARNALILMMKVIEELSDPRQFLDPQRRRDLLKKGRGQLISLTQPVAEDTQEIEQLMANNLVIKETAGDECYVCKSIPVAAVVFRPGTKIRYYHPERSEQDSALANWESKWVVTSTTHSMKKANGRYPQLGYKDATGVINKFQKRKNRDQSMGGVLIDNSTGTMTVLDYDQLMLESRRRLSPQEVIIMGNWYMDSGNQNQVCEKENETVPLNAIGVMKKSQTGESVAFSITSGGKAYDKLRVMAGEKIMEHWPQTKRTVAAMCNLLIGRLGFDSWQLNGVDYNGGGVHPPGSVDGIDRFIIYR